MPNKLLLLLAGLTYSSVGITAEKWSFSEQVRAVAGGQKSYEIANSELEAAKARSLSGKWGFLPSVSASSSRSKTSVGGAGKSTEVDSREMSLEASVNLFKFGGDSAGYNSSTESVKAAELNERAKKLLAEYSAAQALSDAIAAQQEMKVYQRRMTAARQSVQAADARFKKGILSEQELSKLKLEAANLEMSFRASGRRVESTLALLKSWGGSLNEETSWPLAVSPESFKKAKDWLAGAKAGEVKLKALQADADSAQSLVTASRSALLPSLDLSAGLSRSQNSIDDQLTHKKLVMMTLTVPIFSRFSDYGEYRARVYEASSANLSLEAERSVANARFQSVVNEAVSVLDDAKERQDQIIIADRLYQDNLKRFERGLISVNELSLDEHRVRESELAAIEAWENAHLALFKLAQETGESVLGGGIFN